MRNRILSYILGFILCSTAYAKQTTSLDTNKLSDALARARSTDLQTREAAFNDLMSELASAGGGQKLHSGPSEILDTFFTQHPDQSEPVKVGLIQLLANENETFVGKNVPPGSYTEDDMEHYAKVIDAVSSLNDERAIPPLVGAMTTGGMATSGLLKYGDRALGPVLDQLKSSNALVRESALEIGITILGAKHDPASHSQIRSLLQSSLRDKDSAVRAEAIMQIDCFDQRQEFVSALEELAQNDPDRFPGRADDGVDGDWYYPARVQARRVLRDIQTNKTCNPK